MILIEFITSPLESLVVSNIGRIYEIKLCVRIFHNLHVFLVLKESVPACPHSCRQLGVGEF